MGGSNPAAVSGSKGGGGDGGEGANAGVSGSPNTGGGGGGAGNGTNVGGSGGSGIVIIRYPNLYKTATNTGNPIFSDNGTYKIYTFNNTGTLTF